MLGIDVLGAKLLAFGLAAAFAALGGILLTFRNPIIDFSNFPPIDSIEVVAYTVVGGVGFVPGALVGGQLAEGGVGAWILNTLFPTLSPVWLVIVSGLFVALTVVLAPDGFVKPQIDLARRLAGLTRRRRPAGGGGELPPRGLRQPGQPGQIPRGNLHVSDLAVRFGGVRAVNGVSFTVASGEVVALIGPNGAGKTTVIDAICGFVRPSQGEVHLNGASIRGWSVTRRARGGVGRAFQSLELFESSTVRENLQIASDARGWRGYAGHLSRRGRDGGLTAGAIEAVRTLELEPYLDVPARDLPYGRRRLLALARAVATQPAILLLDEPASGLSGTESLELAGVVRRLADVSGIGILLVEHNMRFVMGISDRVVVLNFGNQIAAGSPEEVRRDGGVIHAYLGSMGSAAVATEPPPFEHQPVGGPPSAADSRG